MPQCVRINQWRNSVGIFAGDQIRCDRRIKSPGVSPALPGKMGKSGPNRNNLSSLSLNVMPGEWNDRKSLKFNLRFTLAFLFFFFLAAGIRSNASVFVKDQ